MKPLEGIRIIDFGHVWAAPYCTATLADMGAEVIKIESQTRLDVHRRQGPYPERRPGPNRSGVWNSQNRNKKSVEIDLAQPAGRALARRLVATSDVVVENFSPGVMRRLELGYDDLRAEKPDIIMCSLSAFGQSGPQARYVGYGPSLDAWSGLCGLTAYEDGVPKAAGGVFPDTASALFGAFEILAALRRRDASGEGCYIDLSELEVSVTLLSDLFVRFPDGNIPPEWHGNDDPYDVPQGAYRCAGDDRWIVVAVEDRAAWRGLCAAIGRPQWRDDDAFATRQARRRRRAEIDAAISAWTATLTPQDAFETLQASGVAAGIAQDIPGLLADPQLHARGYFRTVEHAEVGPQVVYGPIWTIEGVPLEVRPAPLVGADTAEVPALLDRA